MKILNLLNREDTTVEDLAEGFKVVTDWSLYNIGFSSRIVEEYYLRKAKIAPKQLIVQLSKTPGVLLQAGAMEMMIGDVRMATGIENTGDFIKKKFKSAGTGEGAIKPEYTGKGVLICEPTKNYFFAVNLSDWDGGIVLEDGAFYCCTKDTKLDRVARAALSSLGGGEGVFNLRLKGNGIAILESKVPKNQLIEIVLNNEIVKIDGPNAIAWSDSLDFTVERSSRSLVGSGASGEGLVNVYRGTGRVLALAYQ